MVTVLQSMQDLEEVAPNGVFRDGAPAARRLLNHGGQIATATVFHEDVEDAGVPVYVAVVITYDMVMVEVFENVAGW